ncbi:hypothetical protein BSKO_04862 [Bryopsis sp. KO-2023]|nr:hypothetical protein BSKO_04862 [Bryopsis sp. KO-2023]
MGSVQTSTVFLSGFTILSVLIVWTLCCCSQGTLSYAAPTGDELISYKRAMPKWLGAGQGSTIRPGSCCRRRRMSFLKTASLMWVYWQ